MRDTQREAETQSREEQAPRREPDAGLDPGTWGHRLGRRRPLTSTLMFYMENTDISKSSVFLILEHTDSVHLAVPLALGTADVAVTEGHLGHRSLVPLRHFRRSGAVGHRG